MVTSISYQDWGFYDKKTFATRFYKRALKIFDFFIFSIIITILACLDRIRIPNPGLDPRTQLNPDPVRIRTSNTGSKQKNSTLKCVRTVWTRYTRTAVNPLYRKLLIAQQLVLLRFLCSLHAWNNQLWFSSWQHRRVSNTSFSWYSHGNRNSRVPLFQALGRKCLLNLESELRIRILRIRLFLGLLDPDPLVRGTDPDPSIIKKK